MKITMSFVFLYLFMGACVPRTIKSVSFLNEDVPYRADPQDNDVMIYRNPNLRVTSYSKFLIDPVKIFSNDSFSLKPEEESLLAENFRKELISSLENGYQVVDKAGPGVLRIRIAIQDIQPAEIDFVEEGAIVLRLDTWLARVAMELECVDSVTGERVAALIHTLRDSRYFDRQKKTRLLNVQNAFGIWTRSLRKRFDEAKMRPNGGFGGPDPEEHRRLRIEEGE